MPLDQKPFGTAGSAGQRVGLDAPFSAEKPGPSVVSRRVNLFDRFKALMSLPKAPINAAPLSATRLPDRQFHVETMKAAVDPRNA